MKIPVLYFIFLIFQPHLCSQGTFISMGNGISNISSNFINRYSKSYNFSLKAGYDKNFTKMGIRASLGYFNLNSKIIEKNRNLNISFVKLSLGLYYQIASSWNFFSQFNIGKTTKKNIRISSPRFNYDFDPIDLSYSFELNKRMKFKCTSCLSIGLEFSKSFDGIIDDNFWQKDNLKPYYLNINIYYHLQNK